MSDPPTTLPIDHDMDSSHSENRVKLRSAIRTRGESTYSKKEGSLIGRNTANGKENARRGKRLFWNSSDAAFSLDDQPDFS